MDKFVRNLLTEWRRLGLGFEGSAVLVAVSGGADSIALAAALSDLVRRGKIRREFRLAHFDHRLRAGSESETELVAGLAGRFGFGFEGGSASGGYPIGRRGNLEENARRARYRFLSDAARALGDATVLTAHTMNDQAETVLFNLVRGSGPAGLAGIPALGESDGITVARPLLGWARRSDTVAYCGRLGIEPLEDPMNDDVRYSRVRIRKEIIPALSRINPRVVDALCRTAGLMPVSGGPAATAAETLPLSEIAALGRRERLDTIRNWLVARRGPRKLTLKHIEAVERLALSKRSGRYVELPGGGAVHRRAGRLSLAPAVSGGDGTGDARKAEG